MIELIVESKIYILFFAFIIDLLIGDPEYKYHPVRLIGSLIYKTEKLFYSITENKKLNGFLQVLFVLIIVVSFVYLVSFISILIELFLVYSFIAIKDLKDKAIEIKKIILKGDLDFARKKLSMIVSRETEKLDEKNIIRGTVETVSENIVDGIITPILFYAVGGIYAMTLYKVISTFDSMIGYKNVKYINYGYFAAKSDDLLNYIPARFSFIILNFTGYILGMNFNNGLKIGLRDKKNNPSPNAGIPEAVIAGLIGVQMGGANYYHGKLVDKPFIGDRINEYEPKTINQVVKIAYLSSLITLVVALTIKYWIYIYG